MRQLGSGAGWCAACLLVLWAGCRATPPKEAPAARADDTGVQADELMTRPLYTFTEAEVGRYLPVAREIEPELGRRVVHLGRKNVGQPYDIYLLGEFPYEVHDPDPIYCLSRSDCLVFSEHMYAMALARDWWGFLRALQRLRYRDGVIGMLTRNHYTIADWDRSNAYLFEDLTTQLGGGQVCVPLQQVCRRAPFFAKFSLGQDIADEPIADHYIPKERVPEIAAELRDGDFVNIIRGNEKSQFCGHTGLIAIAPDGTADFLHSAQPAVREQPLVEFVTNDKRCLGIKILRLRPDAQAIMDRTLASPSAATEVNEGTLRAALAASPLMSTGAPDGYAEDWVQAMRMQAYRLDHDTPTDAALQAAVEDIERRVGDELGIPLEKRAFGVLDLTDQRLALVRPDEMFYGASVPKICILLAYFETHPEAATNLDPQVERELQLMIKRSDNELAAKYSQIVGLEKTQEILQSKKYQFYDREHGGFWCGKHYGVAEPRIGDPVHDHSHAVTVRQCLRYYLLLEQGKLVNAAASAKMKEIFAAPRLEFHNDRFVGGLNGRDVTILRKSGWWEDWHLDTARIQHGERLYILAGMTEHPRGNEYLIKVAAAVDEWLCGVEPRTPDTDERIQHDPLTTLECPAEYESPVFEPELIFFNQVRLSASVAAPADVPYRVELRVGRTFYDTWSPWLYVSGQGEVTAGEARVTEFGQGRVEAGVFQSDAQFDRVQYRVRTGASATPAKVHMDHATLQITDSTGIPTSLPRKPSSER